MGDSEMIEEECHGNIHCLKLLYSSQISWSTCFKSISVACTELIQTTQNYTPFSAPVGPSLK